MSSRDAPGEKGVAVLKRNKSSSSVVEDPHHQFRHSDTASESDSNDDNGSMSSTAVENATTASVITKPTTRKRKNRKSRQEWEILEGLKEGQVCEDKPDKYQGFLLKRRKWPLKGWHKRFFVVDKGILTYAKSPHDIQKGKYHGVIDLGLSVLTFKRPRRRIQIDAEDQIYHIKVKDSRAFEEWLSRLRHHRLYRQHEIAYGTKESPRLTGITPPVQDLPLNSPNIAESLKKDVIRQTSFKAPGHGRVAAWVLDTAGFDQCNKGVSEAQNQLCDLRDLLDQIQNLPLSGDPTLELLETEGCEKKKSRRGFGRSSKKKDSKLGSPTLRDSSETDLAGSGSLVVPERMHSSASNPNLLNHTTSSRPMSLSDMPLSQSHEQRIQEIKLRETFITKGEQVHNQLKSLLHMMNTERERLKQTIESESSTLTQNTNTITSLKQSLFEAQRQNTALKSRLSRIHTESNISDLQLPPTSPILSPKVEQSKLGQSLSIDSFSLSEYYDAEEIFENISESSSEHSDEASSDVSDDFETETDAVSVTCASVGEFSSVYPTGRRSKLPAPRPDTGDISLWNLLYKNIGKDLTKISMPVTLNEPLCTLQRLCEELEYSELLDKAVEFDDPYERMTYIAAFAVSSYASSFYRAGNKPFNPLLGETYECVREDRGWLFVSEQVSHHPPISACFCESKNFTFWQDIRVKTKFWGKSMEIQPLGTVNVCLPKFQDHYKWNKVTTCVHNVLGGQRWVDQYGEMYITNGGIVCKLTFTKASHWSSKRYEVQGEILNPEGNVVHNLFGKWNEAFYCGHSSSARCIWRQGAMPEDSDLYYGFSQFAIELNELDKDQIKFLPPTDSRFRPDQRLLEEGRITEAEAEKQRLEYNQRERRKKDGETEPRWFKKTMTNDKEVYDFTKQYWEARKDPGFSRMSFVKLW
ncbi:oxysterol-binding protein-related protein 6-like [Gigantopelta aegis]|uniref:oxysterol-binding protein-related protein 6-like n=1 Tax=Gigantopelta aegis TaxID=1735272 RepID=UPI001B8899FF|nr:oxysterol-binding protein-related protein 6-like [Gigantopelta aegis]